MLSDRHTHRARQFITVTLNIIGKCEMWVELRIELLWLCSIERRRALVGTFQGLRFHGIAAIRPDSLRTAFVLSLPVNDNTIGQMDLWTKACIEHFGQQV